MNSKQMYHWAMLFLVLTWLFLPTSLFAQNRKSAQVECGNDRRCRIARLKDLNESRRRHAFQKEKAARRAGAELAEAEYFKKYPRSRNPYSVDLRLSLVGFLGLGLGYQFAESFRTQFSYQHVSLSNYNGSRSIELSANQFGLSGEYFLASGFFAPFLSTGFHMMDGEAGETFSAFGGGLGGINGTLHFVELGGGIDIQLNHVRFRLMGAYKVLMYHQGTINGVHDESTKESLKQTFESDMQIDIFFQAGYAF